MIHAYRRFSHAFAFVLALVMVAGCGDDDDGPAGGGTPDTTPPGIVGVTAVDQNHIEVEFNEAVERGSAEETGNYAIVPTVLASTGTSSGGGVLTIFGASLGTDQRTVSLTTGIMGAIPYEMSVTGVQDVNGNAITTAVAQGFDGSDDPDVTAPQLVYRSPAPNATNVPLATPIVLTFSEPIDETSFFDGFTLSSGSGDAPFNASSDDGIHIVVTPTDPLALNTVYTVAMTGFEDEAGNVMPDVSWTFRTTNAADTTPPTIVSSTPADGALNVDVNATVSLTFSEPIHPESLNPSLYPDVGDGDLVWSNGGMTVTFTPFSPFLDDQQYTLIAIPGDYEDLSGNANTQVTQIRFSTGAALAAGSIAGTIDGDPTSDFASDPSGARAFVAIGTDLDDLLIAGSGVVAGNDTYVLPNLSDDAYLVVSLMDSNADGALDPSLGDAIGGYGLDPFGFDLDPDSVTVSGGANVTGIDFQLFDFSTITGSVVYQGGVAGSHFIGVGLFNVVGFDPENEPDFTTTADWPDAPEWFFHNFEYAIPDGSYYVGAFVDTNDNFTYDIGVDPIGFHGSGSPAAVTINDGSDANGIVITVNDLPTALAATHATRSVHWSAKPKNELPSWVHELAKTVAQSDRSASVTQRPAARGWAGSH